MLTLKGYIKTFESCENDSDVFVRLTKIDGEMDVDVWRSYLSSKNLLKPAELLFSYWEKHCDNDKSLKRNDYIKFNQIFSLLENVFRNVLLRPYIPAYRTINMNCGRYRAFVTDSEKELFKMLDFHEYSTDLFTYDGKDPEKTIVYAITCSVFWHVLGIKLKKYSSQ
jgi:hypothetical protein